jgi:hypothetical protein
MQTFLTDFSFKTSAEKLDYRRLGKQRVEARQIYNILTGQQKSKAWTNHPAVLMWKNYENTLAEYHNCMIQEWIKRGYKNTMQLLPVTEPLTTPEWISNQEFINSHRSNLIRKDPIFYGRYNWNLPNDLPYIWPTKNHAV